MGPMKAYLGAVILACGLFTAVTLGNPEIKGWKQEVEMRAAKSNSKCAAPKKQLRVDSKPVPVHCTRAQRLKWKKA